MSLITRCPACRTMFKVVPDQLKISEGWVRCGKCDEIFDARTHMQDAAAEPAPTPGAHPSAEKSGTATGTKRRSSRRTGAKVELTSQAPTPSADVTSPDTTVVEMSALRAEAPLGVAESSATQRKEPVLDDPPTTVIQEQGAEPVAVEPSPTPDAWAATMMADPHHDPLASPAAVSEPVEMARTTSVDDLSFMRDARRKSNRNRPAVRMAWMLSGLLFLLILLGQFIVHERDRIVAREPGLRPMVESLCSWFGCEVRPWRQIDALVIDSSAFSKVKGDLYRLSLTLKNNEAVDLAMPAVELALTDALDRPIIRRVIQPEELGVRDGVIHAAAEFEASVMLTVKTNGSSERIAGYRLFTFYP